MTAFLFIFGQTSILVPHVCSKFRFGLSSFFVSFWSLMFALSFILVSQLFFVLIWSLKFLKSSPVSSWHFFHPLFLFKRKKEKKLTFISQQICSFTKGNDLNAKKQHYLEMNVTFFFLFFFNKKMNGIEPESNSGTF